LAPEIRLIVCGVRGTGKSSVVSALARVLQNKSLHFQEAQSFGTDSQANAVIVETFRAANGVIVVLDQDLRDYEFSAIRSIAALGFGEHLFVVLNKTDLLTSSARAETLSSIGGRVRALLPASDVLEVQADPRPAIRIVTAPDGQEQEIEVERTPKIEALSERIQHMVEN
jgi:hypothetical protein